MKLCVDIGNNLRYILLVSASLIPGKKFNHQYNKYQAIILGLYVRIYKLYDSFCYHTSKSQVEISMIFLRLIYESSIKMQYLIKNDETSAKSFIFTSYKSHTEGIKYFKKLEKQRELATIEKRLLEKWRHQINEDSIAEETLLKNKIWKMDKKSFKDLMREFNIDHLYPFAFGNSSSAVHGDWNDIKFHHINFSDGSYHPDLEYNRTEPGYITGVSINCLNKMNEFLKWNDADPDNAITWIIKPFLEFIISLDVYHEKNVTQVNWQNK